MSHVVLGLFREGGLRSHVDLGTIGLTGPRSQDDMGQNPRWYTALVPIPYIKIVEARFTRSYSIGKFSRYISLFTAKKVV